MGLWPDLKQLPKYGFVGTIQKTNKGKLTYKGQAMSIMEEFVGDLDRLPKDRLEFNSWLKRNRPGWPQLKEAQFRNTLAAFNRNINAKRYEDWEKVAKENRKRLTAFKKEERSIRSRLKKETREALKTVENDMLDGMSEEEEEAYYKKSPKEQEKQLKPFADKIRQRVLSEDPAYNMLKKEMSRVKSEIDRPRPTRPEKERPSGGGSIIVTGDTRKGGAKKGTIATTRGEFGKATQYKFTPVDEVEEGSPYTGKYRVSRPSPGAFNTWEEGGEITADELYSRTRGDFGVKAKEEKPVARDLEPLMGYDPALGGMPEPEIRQRGLAPPGIEDYSGVWDFPIDEEDDYGMQDVPLDEEEEPYGLARYPRNGPYYRGDIPGY